MRKSAIGLLVGVMVFAFVGLFYLQVNYIREIAKTQDRQFEDAVKRSLYEVSQSLERDESNRIYNDQKRLATKNNPLNDNIRAQQQSTDRSLYIIQNNQSNNIRGTKKAV